MSSRGTTIRSLAVWITSEASFCSRMIPEIKPAVGHRQIGERVIPAHGGTRVQNVFENVVGICPVRARQVGADVAARVIELVACEARPIEDGPPSRQVGRLIRGRGQQRFVLGQREPALAFEVGCTLPQTFSSCSLDPPVAKGLQLAGDRDAHVAPGNLPAAECTPAAHFAHAGSRRQSRDRILTLG